MPDFASMQRILSGGSVPPAVAMAGPQAAPEAAPGPVVNPTEPTQADFDRDAAEIAARGSPDTGSAISFSRPDHGQVDPSAPEDFGQSSATPPQAQGSEVSPWQRKLAILGEIDSGTYKPPPTPKTEKGETSPTFASLGMNAGAGANDTIANTAGAPVDLLTGALNLTNRLSFTGRDTSRSEIKNPVGGSESIKKAMGTVGVPNPDETVPQNTAERVMRGVGSAIASVPTMGAAGAGLASAAPGTLAGSVGKAMLNATPTGGALGSTAAASAIGGGLGAGGADSLPEGTPEGIKGLVDLAGNIVGGAGAAIGGAAARKAAGAVTKPIQDFVAPFGKQGQQRLAGQRINNAASNPEQMRADLANGADELVPGSRPTTFQATGDQGVGQLERAARTRNAEPFLQRASEQNAARNAAVEGLQPEGDTSAVGNLIRGHLTAMDEGGQQGINRIRTGVQGRTEELGGIGSPAEYGEGIRTDLATRNREAKAAESRLWNALDPDGTLALDIEPLRQAGADVRQGMGRAAKPMAGEEAAIFDLVQSSPGVVPFQEIRDIRSRIASEIRALRVANPEDQAVRRLTQLRDALDRTVATAAERHMAQESEAVSSGQMAQGDTLAARLEGLRQEWYGDRDVAATGPGRDVGAGSGQDAGSRSAGVSGRGGAARQNNVGSGNASGTPGVSGPPQPNFDDAVAGRYGAARAATVERKSTYRSGTVGEVLNSGRNGAEYRLTDAGVGPKIFKAGPDGERAIGEYIRATQGAQGSGERLEQYIASSLRDGGVILSDGTLDAAKFARWQRRYRHALDAAGEQWPEMPTRLRTIAEAQNFLDTTIAQHTAQMREFQTTAAARFLGEDPGKAVANALKSPENMRQVWSMVRGNPDAEAGLRRMIVEHMQAKLQSTAESGTSGVNLYKSDAFQKFVADNRATLKIAFGGQGLHNLEMVAADLKRANRSVVGSKIPGQSNTAQDTHATGAHTSGGGTSTLTNLVLLSAGEHIAEHVGKIGSAHAAIEGGHHAAGAIVSLVKPVLAIFPIVANALRQSGLTSIDNLVTEAMLNPELARTLVQRLPEQPTVSFQRRLAQRMLATIPAASLSEAQPRRDNREGGGGSDGPQDSGGESGGGDGPPVQEARAPSRVKVTPAMENWSRVRPINAPGAVSIDEGLVRAKKGAGARDAGR